MFKDYRENTLHYSTRRNAVSNSKPPSRGLESPSKKQKDSSKQKDVSGKGFTKKWNVKLRGKKSMETQASNKPGKKQEKKAKTLKNSKGILGLKKDKSHVHSRSVANRGGQRDTPASDEGSPPPGLPSRKYLLDEEFVRELECLEVKEEEKEEEEEEEEEDEDYTSMNDFSGDGRYITQNIPPSPEASCEDSEMYVNHSVLSHHPESEETYDSPENQEMYVNYRNDQRCSPKRVDSDSSDDDDYMNQDDAPPIVPNNVRGIRGGGATMRGGDGEDEEGKYDYVRTDAVRAAYRPRKR